MALVFMDGFDGYNGLVSNMTRAGYGLSGFVKAPNYQTGRFGGQTLNIEGIGGGRFSKPCWSLGISNPKSNDVSVSFYFYNVGAYDASTFDDQNYLIRLTNGANTCGYSIGFTSGGQLRVSNLSPTMSSTDSWAPNQASVFLFDGIWHHVEARFVASNTTTGVVQAWVDGQQVINYENVITANASNSAANAANLMSMSALFGSWPVYYGGAFWRFIMDDLIIWDSFGSEFNNTVRLGNHRVRSLFPRANGTYRQFAGVANTGGNWNAVRSLDDDTSYVEDSAVGDKESFLFDVIPGNPTKIPAITARAVVRNPDIGMKQTSIFLKSGTAEVNANSTIYPVPLLYSFIANASIPLIFHSNPDGNVAWTSGSLANSEIGIKVET